MATTRIHHVYDCDEETLWRDIVFDQDFNRRMFIDHMQFKQWEVVRFDETDREIKRQVKIHPKTGEMPAAISKLIGDNLGFTEDGVFDKKARRYRFKVIPNRLADKLDIRGEVWCEARGEGRTERIVELTAEAKIFAVGGIFERQIINDTRQSYDKSFAFGQRYLQERAGGER